MFKNILWLSLYISTPSIWAQTNQQTVPQSGTSTAEYSDAASRVFDEGQVQAPIEGQVETLPQGQVEAINPIPKQNSDEEQAQPDLFREQTELFNSIP